MSTDVGTDQEWLRDNALEILDSIVDAIVTIDENGVILSVNRTTSEMFGYAREDLIGAPITRLMTNHDSTRHDDYIRSYLRTGEAKIIGIGRELQAVRHDGSTFPINLAINEGRLGDRPYFTGIMRDLSAQKAIEQDLLEQRENLAQAGRLTTMGEMTASIAHEINQPLTAISMYAQACLRLMASESFDEARLRKALESMNEQSLRAGAVIERIQRFVRHEDGSRKPENMNALIGDLVHLAEGDARLHNIYLRFDLDAKLPPIICDSVQIQQVGLNLLRNAIDSMEQIQCQNGNEIGVRTRRTDRGIEIAIVDSGVGMDEDMRESAFTAFRTSKKNGMGMGLSICRSIIEAHGGRLNFYNNPQHGCTFFFELPQGSADA